MFDIFINYFANPISWIFIGLFLFLGLLIGVFLRPWMGNQVLKFIPASHRFIDFSIEEETAISILCKKIKGLPSQRFLKYRPGYTGIVGKFLKKPITRFLGLEGTAYTWKLEEGKQITAGGLHKSIRTVWGEEFYDTIPEEQRKILEESRILVTVQLDEAPLTPGSMRTVSEEDIKQEEDRRASKTFWSEHGVRMTGQWINLLLGIGTGFAICAGLMLLGIINIPAAIPAPATPPPAPTSVLIGSWLQGLIH